MHSAHDRCHPRLFTLLVGFYVSGSVKQKKPHLTPKLQPFLFSCTSLKKKALGLAADHPVTIPKYNCCLDCFWTVLWKSPDERPESSFDRSQDSITSLKTSKKGAGSRAPPLEDQTGRPAVGDLQVLHIQHNSPNSGGLQPSSKRSSSRCVTKTCTPAAHP